ncbi:hypothetical protein BCR37DRAFT_389655 [Protomyces lactucae-debilis]|uniref:Uncharacterized protein n=1 Tax=Protomyces lactucae-debilis TaxID=2754530 RepID=A0A1Y2EV26_PROLT|nr:uncharacterized protein BCR37DRAFT_389655 [Protomyces lactucae-debilis]ORY75423.1 hypothetical protein BCR37DRAFT_389655 [Protomyces lactucae-debilis]
MSSCIGYGAVSVDCQAHLARFSGSNTTLSVIGNKLCQVLWPLQRAALDLFNKYLRSQGRSPSIGLHEKMTALAPSAMPTAPACPPAPLANMPGAPGLDKIRGPAQRDPPTDRNTRGPKPSHTALDFAKCLSFTPAAPSGVRPGPLHSGGRPPRPSGRAPSADAPPRPTGLVAPVGPADAPLIKRQAPSAVAPPAMGGPAAGSGLPVPAGVMTGMMPRPSGTRMPAPARASGSVMRPPAAAGSMKPRPAMPQGSARASRMSGSASRAGAGQATTLNPATGTAAAAASSSRATVIASASGANSVSLKKVLGGIAAIAAAAVLLI